MRNGLTWGVDGRSLAGVDRRQFAKGGADVCQRNRC
jgi:hypothetical protein